MIRISEIPITWNFPPAHDPRRKAGAAGRTTAPLKGTAGAYFGLDAPKKLRRHIKR